ncbi:MAG: urea carboxylase [Alphaproteobacteria bacterium]|nr:urea carboxylase [Alphaproteobacteria bacterium]
MFSRVLIANRGEIAVRIARTLRRLGVRTIAVYSDADRFARHAQLADEAIRIGPAAASESYLNVEALLAAAKASGAEAVHPGYGFLSENTRFARALEAAGIAFIGPTPEQIEAFGLKHRARELAAAAEVPLLPGSALLESLDEARAEAARIGYPVMLKSTAGGGGIGLQRCADESELAHRFDVVRTLARNNFSDGSLYLERFVPDARHVEVQIFGDGKGRVVALGDRDCSLQRRNQKVIEEAPAPGLSDAQRRHLADAAVRLGEAVRYRSAGTVEFLYDVSRRDFYFLEVNTRLQVEHGVTEAITEIDLVAWMVRLAAGETLPLDALPEPKGHAVEARIYAENPGRDFAPSAGTITHAAFPGTARVDHWIAPGTEVSPFYDPLLAKVITAGDTRDAALARLGAALGETQIEGVASNLAYLRAVAALPALAAARHTTRTLQDLVPALPEIDVLTGGPQSSLQEWPGRLGLWDVGVPPSGPMDALSLRLANLIVGNPEGALALEMTIEGARLRFRGDATVALAGAAMAMILDGEAVPPFAPIAVKAGQTLAIGRIQGPGQRAYLAVRGGFDAAPYLGSRATFMLGGFGGATGRALRPGDVLRIGTRAAQAPVSVPLPEDLRPPLTRDWTLRVLIGPHAAPDFFAVEDVETFLSHAYEVHFNSARTGVRLIGPKPAWARPDGGEAGLHPSNIHDNAYSIGAIDFTGDMPIILGPDGPSLGGFVCLAVVIGADQWQLGQLAPGDLVRFVAVDPPLAAQARDDQDTALHALKPLPAAPAAPTVLRTGPCDAVLARYGEGAEEVTLRRSGEDALLVEFGPPVLDLALRFRAHALMERLLADRPPALIDVTPGIRSLQVHVDGRAMPVERLARRIEALLEDLPQTEEISVPSRIVHLPLAWDDPQTRLAIRKYQELVRSDAPWCPSNIEFIRRINGLSSEEDVRAIVHAARYMVLGLGDVYLGAPVATPLDPRHRLVTTKYNPARTWTPENAVGIGGAYLCIYGMEGPGGYQFVGRTLPVWSAWRQEGSFAAGKPWLLRFFDQIRFHAVTSEELDDLRARFRQGDHLIAVEESHFSMADYRRFLSAEETSIRAFKQRQQEAFEAERARWGAEDRAASAPPAGEAKAAGAALPGGAVAVSVHVPGNVWTVDVREGDLVSADDVLLVIESMKMEIAIPAPVGGRVAKILARPGQTVAAGDVIAAILPEEARP